MKAGRKTYGSFSKKDGRVALKKGDCVILNKFLQEFIYEKDTFSIVYVRSGF